MYRRYQDEYEEKLEWTLSEAKEFFEKVHKTKNSKFKLDNKKIDPNDYNGRIFNLLIPEERHELIDLIDKGVYLNNIYINVVLTINGYCFKRVYKLENNEGENTKYIFYCIIDEYNRLAKSYRSVIGYDHKRTVLDKFLDPRSPFSNCIPILVRKAMRLLKFSSKGIYDFYNFSYNPKLNNYLNMELIWSSIELYLMIITTERYRSGISPLMFYNGMYAIKHEPIIEKQRFLLDMCFAKYDSSLIFTSKDGVFNIHNTDPEVFYESFKGMIEYAPFNRYQKNSSIIKYKFYRRKLLKLKALCDDEMTPSFSQYRDEYNMWKMRFAENNKMTDQGKVEITITPTNNTYE